MTTLRQALQVARLNTMRRRRAETAAKAAKCQCAVCAGRDPLGALLRTLGAEPAEPEADTTKGVH